MILRTVPFLTLVAIFSLNLSDYEVGEIQRRHSRNLITGCFSRTSICHGKRRWETTKAGQGSSLAMAAKVSRPAFAIIKAQAAHAKRPSRRSLGLLLHPCRNHFFGRIGSRRIDRTDEGDDLPKVVRGLDGKSHRRHGGMHAPIGDAIEAPFFQLR